MTKENLISKIRMLSELEHNKLDRYFMCGSLSGTPNEELMYACDNYLEQEKAGKVEAEVFNRMISELEKVQKENSEKHQETVGVKIVDESSEVVAEILENRELL